MRFKIGDKVKMYERRLILRQLLLNDKEATIIGNDEDWFIIRFDFEETGLLHNAKGVSNKEDCYYVREEDIVYANELENDNPFVVISISTLEEMVTLLEKHNSYTSKLKVIQELKHLIETARGE